MSPKIEGRTPTTEHKIQIPEPQSNSNEINDEKIIVLPLNLFSEYIPVETPKESHPIEPKSIQHHLTHVVQSSSKTSPRTLNDSQQKLSIIKVNQSKIKKT
jgi:hypothetical protein